MVSSCKKIQLVPDILKHDEINIGSERKTTKGNGPVVQWISRHVILLADFLTFFDVTRLNFKYRFGKNNNKRKWPCSSMDRTEVS